MHSSLDTTQTNTAKALWDSAEALQARLQAYFQHVAATRMDGVFLLNPALRVKALGFAQNAESSWWQGILITPWFMNMLRFPVHTQIPVLSPGKKAIANVWGDSFEFIGAHEPGLGHYEMCSLFSSMSVFTDQESALATAQEVLHQLQAQEQAAQQKQAEQAALSVQDDKVASRRRFLFGSTSANQSRPGA